MVSIFPRPPQKVTFSTPPGQSKGILDDYAVRKVIDTKEGTIQKVPVNPKDIVNKEYVDSHGITGSGANKQIALWTGTSSLGGDSLFLFNSSTNRMSLNTTNDTDGQIVIRGEDDTGAFPSIILYSNNLTQNLNFNWVDIVHSNNLRFTGMNNGVLLQPPSKNSVGTVGVGMDSAPSEKFRVETGFVSCAGVADTCSSKTNESDCNVQLCTSNYYDCTGLGNAVDCDAYTGCTSNYINCGDYDQTGCTGDANCTEDISGDCTLLSYPDCLSTYGCGDFGDHCEGAYYVGCLGGTYFSGCTGSPFLNCSGTEPDCTTLGEGDCINVTGCYSKNGDAIYSHGNVIISDGDLYMDSTRSAPSTTTSPAAWTDVIINSTTYKLPLYT